MTTDPTAQATSPHLLLVDDDFHVREILSRFLSSQGYTVTPCASGVEMWAAMAARPPNLVLLDVELPGEDGYALASRLRSTVPAVGIIMLSGHAEMRHKVHGLESGADDFLSKPCHRGELLARIRSVLRRAGPAVTSAIPPEKETRPETCPNCGSRVRYSTPSEAGVLGGCQACGWHKFYAG